MDVQERLQATLTGRYDIEREIGRGGMATVYLARDVRHERAVALKVLDPELGAVLGAERFLAEIKTTANLQHPNLLPLFDSGEADGLLFYVMPYVEGESLRARLDREKQFSVDEAIHIGVAILNALHYAHEHGVIHRDLKPENILLQAGQPVIADFGIALAVSKAGGARITQTGLSLGTPQYMSPEQATGDRTIDGRTDIYSLAAMAYEMLTGEPPHLGGTSQAIIAKLMTERPSPVTNLRPNVPPHVNAAIMHALEKLPADRFATARDFATALSTPGTLPATHAYALAQPAPARSRAARFVVPALAAVAVLALGVAGWALTRPLPVSRVTRVEVAIPDSMAPLPFSTFALSPDGNSVVYAGPSANGARLWLKARDRARPTLLAAVNAVNPTFTFSPDGQWVAYSAGGRLAKTPTVGGASIAVADTASTTRGVAWLADNTLVFVRDGGLGLKRVSAAGGAVTMLMKSDSGVLAVPTALPRSRGVLFTRCIGANCVRALDLWVLDLKSGQSERLVQGAVRGWYAPSGHLLYVRPDGAMLAAPFDLSSLKLTGDAVPVLDSVSVFNGVPMFAVSDEGTVVMRSGASVSVQPTHTLVWVDRTGRESVVDSAWTFRATVTGGNVGWSLSPDGRRVAIGLNTGAGDDIWIKQLPNGPLSRLSFDSLSEHRPRWMPDGRSVAYTLHTGTTAGLARRAADGTGAQEMIIPIQPDGPFEHMYSADGRWLVLRMGGTVNVVGGRRLFAMQIGKDSVPRPLTGTRDFDESALSLSPDGKWIAFESNETGRMEVYIRPFPDVNAGKWQLSNAGGRAPLWTRSGKELFFVNDARDMVVVPLAPANGTPGLGERKTLFHMRDEWYLSARENYRPFDISPDGQRFLMARQLKLGLTQLAPIVFVDNWFQELRQRLQKK